MPVKLKSEVVSAAGNALFTELQDYSDDLEYRCCCPDGLWCEVVLGEFYDGVYDVIVTRPGLTEVNPEHWALIAKENKSIYVRSFSNPTSFEIASAVAQLIATPIVSPK